MKYFCDQIIEKCFKEYVSQSGITVDDKEIEEEWEYFKGILSNEMPVL